jgi:divalent metal cation (Fe/Co/Zn/Cd) transporter
MNSAKEMESSIIFAIINAKTAGWPAEIYREALVDGLAIGVLIFIAGVLVVSNTIQSFREIFKPSLTAIGFWISFSGIAFMLPFITYLHNIQLVYHSILLLPVLLVIAGNRIIRISNRR